MTDDTRYSFIVEWYEELAARTRSFKFFYFANTKSIEMFDMKTRKLFLKTSLANSPIELHDLYIGASINVLGRQLQIVGFADEYTGRMLATKLERTLGFIKPDTVDKMADIIDSIYQRGLLISKMRMCRLNKHHASTFYEEQSGKPSFSELVDSISSGPVVAFELVGDNAVQRWRELIGPTDPSRARAEAPTSLRARYGTKISNNAVHGSDSSASTDKEIEFFFPSCSKPTFVNCVKGSNSTCCIIKPHAVKAGIAGKIINAIQDSGFTVNTAQMYSMEKANVEEFYEVYKGVVREYPGMVNELCSGPIIVLEVIGSGHQVPEAFRETCGPSDPEIARHLRPRSLRALFGKDKIQNAVHCTDLPEDGVLEVEYFFKVLDR